VSTFVANWVAVIDFENRFLLYIIVLNRLFSDLYVTLVLYHATAYDETISYPIFSFYILQLLIVNFFSAVPTAGH
jgi:hypothetical protein